MRGTAITDICVHFQLNYYVVIRFYELLQERNTTYMPRVSASTHNRPNLTKPCMCVCSSHHKPVLRQKWWSSSDSVLPPPPSTNTFTSAAAAAILGRLPHGPDLALVLWFRVSELWTCLLVFVSHLGLKDTIAGDCHEGQLYLFIYLKFYFGRDC